MIGYDIDGILCEDSPFINSLFYYSPKIAVYLRNRLPLKSKPVTGDSILVTLRPEIDRKTTSAWLAKRGVKYKHLIMSKPIGVRVYDIILKSIVINAFSLPTFVESDPYSCIILEKLTKASVLDFRSALDQKFLLK